MHSESNSISATQASRCSATLRSRYSPDILQPFEFSGLAACLLSGRDGSARLSVAAVPPLCALELGLSLRTVAAALETLDVVGRVGIVLLAPPLHGQVSSPVPPQEPPRTRPDRPNCTP